MDTVATSDPDSLGVLRRKLPGLRAARYDGCLIQGHFEIGSDQVGGATRNIDRTNLARA